MIKFLSAFTLPVAIIIFTPARVAFMFMSGESFAVLLFVAAAVIGGLIWFYQIIKELKK